MGAERTQLTRRAGAARKRTTPRENVENALWLVLQLGDVEVWTSARALRKSGLRIAWIAEFLQRKYQLTDPKRARPIEAFSALLAAILPAKAVIHEQGHA